MLKGRYWAGLRPESPRSFVESIRSISHPIWDMGDCVVVINAEKVYLSGNKETKKTYFRHTGYPGGGKETTLDHLRHTYPERIVTNAIKGMLPHNRLGRKVLSHLKVYAGAEHPHHAQKPQELKI